MVLYEDELADNGISLLTAKVVCSRFYSQFLADNVFQLISVRFLSYMWCAYSYSDSISLLHMWFSFTESNAYVLVSLAALLGKPHPCSFPK